jgi:hypothetical protein
LGGKSTSCDEYDFAFQTANVFGGIEFDAHVDTRYGLSQLVKYKARDEEDNGVDKVEYRG